MREIKHKRFHFIYSLTLLTLKEEESFKKIRTKNLQSVRKRVNLALFGFVQTLKDSSEIIHSEIDTALY